MNVNLISPANNGNKYTIRFKEDIIIPKNSTVQLNSATLSRSGDIRVFDDSQVIFTSWTGNRLARGYESVYSDNLPKFQSDGISYNDCSFVLDVPAGIYTYDRLFVRIANQIKSKINSVAPNLNDIYQAITLDKLKNNNNTEANFTMGFMKKNHTVDDFVEGSNHLNSAQLTSGGAVCSYNKTDASTSNARGKTFTSYSMCSFKSNFANYDDDTPTNQLSIVDATTINDITAMLGTTARVVMGFSSNEVNDGFMGTNGAFPLDDADRTNGTHLQNIVQTPAKDDVAGFLTLTLDCSSGSATSVFLRVKVASKVVSSDATTKLNAVGSWRNSNEPINHMLTVKTIKLVDGQDGIDFDDSVDGFRFSVQFYYRVEDRLSVEEDSLGGRRRDRVYYRVLNPVNVSDPNLPIDHSINSGAILFDSISLGLDDVRAYFSPTFFLTQQTAQQPTAGSPSASIIARRVSAQLPFNVFFAADTQNEGIDTCFIDSVDGGTVSDGDTIIQRYNIHTDSPELASALNIPTTLEYDGDVDTFEEDDEPQTNTFFPNGGDANDSRLVKTDNLNLNWKEKGYSIYLEGLPIKNFKNNDKVRSGGFAKPIVANIPAPFSNITAGNFSGRDLTEVSTVYEPANPRVSNMYNQPLSTNQLGVEIRDMATDTPSTEITKSVVNITITPPAEYKGNLDSIAGLP